MLPQYKIKNDPDLICVEFESDKHINALYELLLLRSHSISHKKNPSKTEHKRFCLSHPYRYWYLIFKSNELIGTFCLSKENAIGIHLLNEYEDYYIVMLKFILQTFDPLLPVPSIVPKNFYCNIAPTNLSLIEASKELGGEMCQVAYTFDGVSNQ